MTREPSRTVETFDVFFCVHHRDIGPMLTASVMSYMLNFRPKGELVFVTSDAPRLQRFLAETFPDLRARVTSDETWLSRREQALPGWFKQQIIKLRSYEFCSTPNFCNQGADTLLLQTIEAQDLVANNFPVLYYSRRVVPNVHTLFELRRVLQVSRILKVSPRRSLLYVDFINDFFCFNADALKELNSTLARLHGPEALIKLLENLDPRRDQTKFGEWTLYSVFLLDRLKIRLQLRNATTGYLEQIHSRRNLRSTLFNSKVSHLVSKDFDWPLVRTQLARRGVSLADLV